MTKTHATEQATFHVRNGDGRPIILNDKGETSFTDSTCIITRSVRQHNGWQSVTYKGKRYILRGGIRTHMWINLSMPIKGRGKRA
jgi:hypothetical protein